MELTHAFQKLSLAPDVTEGPDEAIVRPAIVAPSPAPRGPRFASPWWGRAILAVVLIAFALFVGVRAAAGMTEPDDNGYFAQATLLFQTGRTWFSAASDAQYVGMHWLLTPGEYYLCRYPPGLPTLIGAVYAIGGWKACAYVNPALATLALAGLYVATRRLTASRGWAIAATVLLAINPTFVRHALAMDSHMAVACCLTWGVALLIAWQRDGRLWQLFVAGLVLGFIPTVRYPEALLAVGVGAFLLANIKTHPKIGRHYLIACLGAAVPIVPLLVRNQLLLGGFWRTGYSLTNEQTGFGWSYFAQHAVPYVQTLNGDGLGLAFALSLVGLTWMCCQRGTRASGALLTLSTIPLLLLYMAYYWGPQGNAAMTMRFLVPTFPIYVLAAVWMLAESTRAAPRAARIAVPVVLVAAQLAWGGSTTMRNANQMAENKRRAVMLTDAIAANVPGGSVIVAAGNVQQQLDFVRQWKLADLALMTGRGGGPGGGGGNRGGMGGNGPMNDGGPMGGMGPMGDGGPDRMGGPPGDFGGGGPGMMGGPGGGMGGAGGDDPSPQQQAKREYQRKLYPGTTAQREAKFIRDVTTWAAGSSVYLVGNESDLKQAFNANSYKVVGRVTLPASQMPLATANRGGMMGGPGGGNRGMGMGGGMNRNRGGMGGPGGGGGGGGGGPMMGVQAGEYVIAIWTPAVKTAWAE